MTWEVWLPVAVQIGVGGVAIYTTVVVIRQELTYVRQLAEGNRRDIDLLRESQAYDRGRRDRRRRDAKQRR